MIRGGTTTFADMYYFEDDVARAVDKAGLRAVLGETFIDFPVPDHKDLPETLTFMDGFVRQWKGHPRIVPAAAPHSGYTCSRETLLAARDYRDQERIPLLIAPGGDRQGAARTPARSGASRRWPTRKRSGSSIRRSAARAGVPVVARALRLPWTRRTARSSSVRRGGLPQSRVEHEARFGDRGRSRRWEKEGLLWGLGTDGPAGSNNDLSMFESMDFAGKLAKVSTGDRPSCRPGDLVAAATRWEPKRSVSAARPGRSSRARGRI